MHRCRFLKGSEKISTKKSSETKLLQRIGPGLVGVGGILYSLVRVSEFINDESLLQDAQRIAELLTPEQIKDDKIFDFVTGTAGLITGLLILSDKGYDNALSLAVTCGEHLLDNRIVDPVTKRRAWTVQTNVLVSGFAHGSSGIAHSLLRLHKKTVHSHFYNAAIESFSFERSLYNEDMMNWLDFRNQQQNNMCSWCHGATGIGFSRLSALDQIKEPDEIDIARDLMNSIQKTISFPLQQIDNLCCGNFGRIEFLFEAGKRLENPSLIEAALNKASARLDYVKKYEFKIPLPDIDNPHLEPGFWKGLAGCGYSLLRLTGSNSFPCILLME